MLPRWRFNNHMTLSRATPRTFGAGRAPVALPRATATSFFDDGSSSQAAGVVISTAGFFFSGLQQPPGLQQQ